MPATERHQPLARDRRRQVEEGLQAYPIGFFRIDIAGIRTEESKLHLFAAIDRTSKFAFAQLHQAGNIKIAAGLLQPLVQAVPYRIHTVLTDSAIQHRSGPAPRYRVHMFDRICLQNGIAHRFSKPNHPWTNGQVEGMNRTLKQATVRRYHYSSRRQFQAHLHACLDAYIRQTA